MLESHGAGASMDAESAKNNSEKTLALIDLRVKDSSTNLDQLAARIMKIKKDGLSWIKEYKVIPLGNGGEKLRVQCELDNDKMLVNGIINDLDGYEKLISSV